MDSLFSLDVTGESFPEEPVVELDSPDEDESSINVKDVSDSKVNVSEEEVKFVKISLASHIRDIHGVDHSKNLDQYELYRKITLEIRKFIYNSIVSEDFCIKCTVVKDSDSDVSKTDYTQPPSSGLDAEHNMDNTGDEHQASEDADSHLNIGANGDTQMGFDDYSTISPKTSMSLDNPDDAASVRAEDVLESLTSSEAETITSEDSLESISLETSGSHNASSEAEPNENFKDSDCIILKLSPTKLNRTIMEMAHVQMRRFFSSYPKNFKITTGNVGADVFALGRRYYVSSDQSSSGLSLEKMKKNHVFYLSHLYRRQRSVCYYCGFVRCARSASSKTPCEYQKCSKCVGTHKWSYNSCKGNGKVLEQYLRASDWRIRRPNLWSSQSRSVRELLRCFYCNNEGEANFKCQGLSCPEGLQTLPIRCLELMGKSTLKLERHKNPHLFPHMSNGDFVFTKNFKVNYKR